MAERFISLREVLNRTSLSKTHTYRLIKVGTHPRPVPLGPHRVAFLLWQPITLLCLTWLES